MHNTFYTHEKFQNLPKRAYFGQKIYPSYLAGITHRFSSIYTTSILPNRLVTKSSLRSVSARKEKNLSHEIGKTCRR